MKYNKPALSFPEQLQQLKEQGLIAQDENAALHYLRYIGYHRLKGYCLPFQGQDGLRFKQGTTFGDVLDLYVFDRALRVLLLDAVERIEIAFRSTLSNVLSIQYGPHWYVSAEHFGHRYGRKRGRRFDYRKVLQELEKSEDEAITAYRQNYSDPLYPPSWVAMESLSFGTCSMMFAHLKKRQIRLVSDEFKLDPTLLSSWMQGLTRLRNICAHHLRTWNRQFAHRLAKHGQVPSVMLEHLESTRNLYAYISVIKLFLDKVSPNSGWPNRLDNLFKKHPKVPLSGMGFPEDWKARPLWSHCF